MWTLAPTAEAELIEAIGYIADRNPQAARALLERVLRMFDRLGQHQLEGRLVTLRSGAPVRRWTIPPLVVFYDRTRDGVAILRVRHGARRPITR